MEEINFEIVDGVEVAASALCVEQKNRYGSVPGLDDEELADPDELERQVVLEELGPILCLPRPKRSEIRPDIDEDFGVDWGAFGTVDFDRYRPAADPKKRVVAVLLRKLTDVLSLIDIVKARLPPVRSVVLNYLRRGVIDMGHIESWDMYQLAELVQRAKKLQAQVARLQEHRKGMLETQREALFG